MLVVLGQELVELGQLGLVLVELELVVLGQLVLE